MEQRFSKTSKWLFRIKNNFYHLKPLDDFGVRNSLVYEKKAIFTFKCHELIASLETL